MESNLQITRNREPTRENLVMVDKNDDLLSKFPDDILFHIISLLPVECAVRTSFLSKYWRNLWNKVPELKGSIEDIPVLVLELFDPYDRHPQLPHHREVRFRFGESNLLVATIEGNKELHLKFSDGSGQGNSDSRDWFLPSSFENFHVLNPVSSLDRALEVLRLTSVSYLTIEKLSSLMTYFSNLASLHIAECKGLKSLSLRSCCKVTSLTISDCPELIDVQIFSVNLRKFSFRGKLAEFWFYVCKNSLEIAKIDFREGPRSQDVTCCKLAHDLLALKNVKILTISGWLFSIPIKKLTKCKNSMPTVQDFYMFNNLKELRWIESSMESHKIDTLLSFLLICPCLEKLFITMDPTSYSCPREGDSWFQPKEFSTRSNASCHNNLRVIELENFTNQNDEIALADTLCDALLGEIVFILQSKWHNQL